jgi:hypothetical protein
LTGSQAIRPTFIIASGRTAQQQFIPASATYTPLRWGPMVGRAGEAPVFGVAHLKFRAPQYRHVYPQFPHMLDCALDLALASVKSRDFPAYLEKVTLALASTPTPAPARVPDDKATMKLGQVLEVVMDKLGTDELSFLDVLPAVRDCMKHIADRRNVGLFTLRPVLLRFLPVAAVSTDDLLFVATGLLRILSSDSFAALDGISALQADAVGVPSTLKFQAARIGLAQAMTLAYESFLARAEKASARAEKVGNEKAGSDTSDDFVSPRNEDGSRAAEYRKRKLADDALQQAGLEAAVKLKVAFTPAAAVPAASASTSASASASTSASAPASAPLSKKGKTSNDRSRCSIEGCPNKTVRRPLS